MIDCRKVTLQCAAHSPEAARKADITTFTQIAASNHTESTTMHRTATFFFALLAALTARVALAQTPACLIAAVKCVQLLISATYLPS